MVVTLVLTACVVVVLIIYVFFENVFSKGPPHATGLPFVGYAPLLGKDPHITLHQLSQKYGPVFSLYLGSTKAVVLGNYEALHEAFIKKDKNFTHRPQNLVMKVYPYETAFLYLSGEEWRTTRNFTVSTLKSFGFGRKSMESYLMHDVDTFIQEIKMHVGHPMPVEHLLAELIGNSVLRIITGDRHGVTVHWKNSVIHTADQLGRSYSYDITVLFPWISRVPVLTKLFERKVIRALKQAYWKLWETEIDKQREEFLKNPGDPQSFFHYWFAEQSKREKDNRIHKKLFTTFGLKNNLDILVQASVDTTSAVLLWAFLYLTYYEDVQKKVQAEIDRVIGENREAKMDDMKDMEYTKAFLQEVYRRGVTIPVGVFHRNKDKDTILGYEIAADSLIVSNLWGVHHDSNVFPEPDNFNPARFIDAHGNFVPSAQVVPFSIGGRICPGKGIAEMQVFLTIITVLQTFRLRPPNGVAEWDIEATQTEKSFIRRPVPFDILFEPRHT